jgi:hypothetical protein
VCCALLRSDPKKELVKFHPEKDPEYCIHFRPSSSNFWVSRSNGPNYTLNRTYLNEEGWLLVGITLVGSKGKMANHFPKATMLFL